MNHINFKARQHRLLVALLALTLAACGTRRVHEREHVQGQGNEWRAAGGTSSAPLLLTSPRIDAASLSFAVQSQRIEHEVVFDLVVHEEKRTRDPSLGDITAGVVTLGLMCLPSSMNCFGKSGEWEASAPQRRNQKPSGRTRPLVERYDGPVAAGVLLQGLDAAGAVIGQAQSSVSGSKGTLSVPVKSLVEQLPKRPDRVLVTTTLQTRPAQTEPARQTLGAEALAPMKLYAEHWLPPAEQQAIVIGRLKAQLLAGDHAAALKNFAGLEALPLPLPNSFLYLYAQSLARTGAADRSRAYLEKYLTASGDEGAYVAEAKAQLAAR